MQWIEFVVKVPKECVEPVCNLFSKYSSYGFAIEEYVLDDRKKFKSCLLYTSPSPRDRG